MMTRAESTRVERDSMGVLQVPAEAYFGASTQRAVDNFPISGWRFPRQFLRALGLIKKCAAQVNAENGWLSAPAGEAIVAAADEVARGELDAHFVVDVFQTGSGTSTNMNANEVIANRAAELSGGCRGDRRIHPNDQVNLGQSSNDVIPTTIHLAAALTWHEILRPALTELHWALREKAEALWPILKTGRTHLQDATPIRLGQEFLGFAGQVDRAQQRVANAVDGLGEVPLGGTAVGTGLSTHPRFAEQVCGRLCTETGLSIRETDNHFQAQSTLDNVAPCMSALKNLALALTKIATDISWLGSGPRAGLGELRLPVVQPGSSIMPGKVNPVIAESLLQVCAQVVGWDAAATFAAQRSCFQLNTMWPVVGYNLLQAMDLLAAGVTSFAQRCVAGLSASERGPDSVEQGLALATALVARIGYDRAAEISKRAAAQGQTIREVAREQTDLDESELAALLDAETMVEPHPEPSSARDVETTEKS